MLTQTIPLPAGGAGWLALGFSEEALLDFAGFVVAAELDGAGAAELAGAEDRLVEAERDVAAGGALELLASAEAFVDFFVLADLVPESALDEAVESALASVAEALVEFFELADLELASAGSVEPAFADFDFFELVDLVSAEGVSPEDLVDFLVLADLVSLAELSEVVDLVFLDFDADESDLDLSVASVELASVAFFWVGFFVELALESVVSVFCALIGAKLASPSPRPAETRNANTYFLSDVILIPPQFRAVV